MQMQMRNRKWQRRNILKSIGGIAGISSLSGLSTAKGKKKQNQSAEAAGVVSAAENLLHQNEVLAAVDLLERHDVEHYHVRQTRPTISTDSDGISTQDFYTKSQSDLDLVVYNLAGTDIRYGTYWYLDNGLHDYDGPKPQDAAVLAFDEDVFDYIPGSVNHHGQLLDGAIYDDQTNLLTYPTKATAEHRDRAVVEMLDGAAQAEYASGYLEMDLETTSEVSWLSANYTHTWSFTNTAQWSNLLEDIGVAINGLISVGVPDTADSWEFNEETVA